VAATLDAADDGVDRFAPSGAGVRRWTYSAQAGHIFPRPV
jgi:hypothetical protein